MWLSTAALGCEQPASCQRKKRVVVYTPPIAQSARGPLIDKSTTPCTFVPFLIFSCNGTGCALRSVQPAVAVASARLARPARSHLESGERKCRCSRPLDRSGGGADPGTLYARRAHSIAATHQLHLAAQVARRPFFRFFLLFALLLRPAACDSLSSASDASRTSPSHTATRATGTSHSGTGAPPEDGTPPVRSTLCWPLPLILYEGLRRLTSSQLDRPQASATRPGECGSVSRPSRQSRP